MLIIVNYSIESIDLFILSKKKKKRPEIFLDLCPSLLSLISGP
jgi:hypothetical protein